MSNPDSSPYRYELWKLDAERMVHARITDKKLDVQAPEIIGGREYENYPVGYEWRVYRAQRELGRWEVAV